MGVNASVRAVLAGQVLRLQVSIQNLDLYCSLPVRILVCRPPGVARTFHTSCLLS